MIPYQLCYVEHIEINIWCQRIILYTELLVMYYTADKKQKFLTDLKPWLTNRGFRDKRFCSGRYKIILQIMTI